MATVVLIPKLGMTMTEGCVREWKIPDGGHIEAGEIVYLLETEKIEFEVEAEAAGTLRHLVPEQTKLPVGAATAYILAPGEPMPEGVSVTLPAPAAIVPDGNGAVPVAARTLEGGRLAASPIARRLAKEAGIDLRTVAASGPDGRIVEADVIAARQSAAIRPVPPAAAAPTAEVLASPLARRLAEQHGLDLRRVPGTGPGGRITKEDVEQAAATPTAAPAPTAPRTAATPGGVIPLRGMRGVIAERMHASLQEMAQLTLGMTIGMDEAVKLRAQLVQEWEDEGVKPSYTDLVVKAVAKALQRHPRLNARITDQGIELLPDIHVGVAVALDEGLMVPVVRDAARRPLKEIAAETARLAEAARTGKIGVDELTGGTFAVTALGMYGVEFFTPVINPPNVAILGVGVIRHAFGWEGERPVRRQEMTLSLTIDHRAVDGAPAAAFLGAVRDLLEAPYRILV
jgi:pyruvate dehydrogenase E2 component (dihydrolipoamide acetyltransferase)